MGLVPDQGCGPGTRAGIPPIQRSAIAFMLSLRSVASAAVSPGTPLFQHIGRIPERSPHDQARERLSSHALAAPHPRVLGFAHA